MSRLEIVDYRESWPAEFALLAGELERALGPLARRIDHIGSTSVPGLAAKDVLDVQVGVASLERGPIVEALCSLGCVLVAEIERDHRPPGAAQADSEWRKIFFRSPPGTRRANIHVRVAGAANARYSLLFRDFLRAHPRAAAAYAELKQKLAALEPPLTIGQYADVKDPACDLVMVAAEEWATATDWSLGDDELDR